MNLQKILRHVAAVLLIVAGLTPAIAHAEIKTYEGVGDYILTEDDPPKEIKDKAKLYAERNALEKAGVFISTYSKTKNFELVEDEIISITGSILKIVDTNFEIIPLNDKTGIAKYRATVIAEIDTDKIDAAFEKWLGRDKKERSSLAKQNEELQKIIDEQNKRIAALEETARNAKTDIDNQKVREEIKVIDKETLYAQKLDEAQKLMKAKKYEDAVKIYTEAIDIKPDSAEAYYNRSLAYRSSDKSFQDINKAIELNTNYAKAYYQRGWIYYEQKNYDAAIKDFDKTIELEPNNFRFYENRGMIYCDIKNYDAAIRDLSKAIELNPRADVSYWFRAHAYEELENYDKAVCDNVKAIEIDPDEELFYTGLSLVVDKAKSDKSIDALTKLIKIKPNEAESYSYRGCVYYNQKKYDAAIKDFSRAVKLNPNLYKSYSNRGIAYYELKNYDAAIKDFSKAIELTPNTYYYLVGSAYYWRGKCYEQLGNNAQAQVDFDKAKELGYNG